MKALAVLGGCIPVATVARDADATHQAPLETLRSATAAAADETGWRIDAERNWLWVSVADTATVPRQLRCILLDALAVRDQDHPRDAGHQLGKPVRRCAA
ncbi:MAG: hypothetical protein ACRDYA_04830 [Egibacteraceae bacterium]